MLRYLAAAAVVTFASAVATATTTVREKFVCPIGGEKFTADVIASMTSWGQRPDGRRYGTSPVVPLTECPGNGFLYFEEKLSKDDITKLSPLLLGTEYQAMRKSETSYYRAWWLMNQLGRDPFDSVYMLLASSWEADDDPVRKGRYQRLFIEAAGKLVWSEEKRDDWFWFNLRAANAHRELGQFDESSALLFVLDDPERLPKEADALEGARILIDGLKVLNAERNSAREPANLIPHREAAYRCSSGEAPALSLVETLTCGKPEVREWIERLKQRN